MSKELKWLYQTSVDKLIETKETVKDPKDPSIEITKTVKKKSSVKVGILKPSRKLFESAEIFYATKVADYIRIGLLPFSLVQKRYANDGGPLSEPEKKVIEDLRDEVTKCKGEYFAFATDDTSDDTKTKKNELLVRINDINTKLNNIENAYSDIFDNTAEVKARNKTIEWWVLHLTYYAPDKDYKCIFGDGNYEEKYQVYDGLEDQDDPFLLEIISLCSYLISFWLTARGSLTKDELAKIEFNTMEKLYLETVSTYKIEETEEKPQVQLTEEAKKVEDVPLVPLASPIIPKIT